MSFVLKSHGLLGEMTDTAYEGTCYGIVTFGVLQAVSLSRCSEFN